MDEIVAQTLGFLQRLRMLQSVVTSVKVSSVAPSESGAVVASRMRIVAAIHAQFVTVARVMQPGNDDRNCDQLRLSGSSPLHRDTR